MRGTGDDCQLPVRHSSVEINGMLKGDFVIIFSLYLRGHRAAAYGLHMLPITQFSLRSLQRDGLLLGFASASPQELRAGVQTLALALQAH